MAIAVLAGYGGYGSNNGLRALLYIHLEDPVSLELRGTASQIHFPWVVADLECIFSG